MSGAPLTEALQILLDALKLLLTVGAAVWVYYRFARERTHARRVEFEIESTFFGPQAGAYVVEFVFRISNKGLVIHRFKRLRFRVLGIKNGQRIERWEGQSSRVLFPEKLVKEDDVIFARKFGHIFVEPGVEQKITFVTSIPEDVSFVLARAEFEYIDSRTHSTERVFTSKSIQRTQTSVS